MRLLILTFILFLGTLGLGNIAHATILSGGVTLGSGAFNKLTVPFTESTPDSTVGQNNLNTDDLYGFDEIQDIILFSDLSVDDIADGFGGGAGAGTLFSGTQVSSHYIFFDPSGLFIKNQEGFVNFDSDVLAIISGNTNLADSDFLGNPAVTYVNTANRGLEGDDLVSITGLQQISVDWASLNPGDYIRVVTQSTASVPVPSALVLIFIGLFGVRFFGIKNT